MLTAIIVVASLAAPAVGATSSDRPTAAAPVENRTANVIPGENRTANATVSRARGALFDDLRSVESLRAARSRGELVRSRFRNGEGSSRPAFVPGDVLVVRIESERLATALLARNGSTPTERYLDYVNRTDARLQILQTPRTTTPERQRQRVLANESRIRVLAENDTRWLLLDTGNLTVGYGDDASPHEDEIHGGRAFGVWFDFSTTVEGLPPVENRPRVAVVPAAVEFGATPGHDRVYLSPSTNATLRLSSTLAPGTAVTVRAHLPDRTAERRVVLRGQNRTTATARFDLSVYEDGRSFRLTAVWRGERVGETTGVVDVPNATLRVGERDPWDAVVTVTANLSRGGTVVLRSTDGSVRYDSTTVEPRSTETRVLYLPATELSNRTRFAVVAFCSVEDDPVADEAVPYREDGSAVLAIGVYDPDAGPPTRTPTATSGPPVTTSSTPTATATTTATQTDRRVTGAGTPLGSAPATTGDGAGFGPLAAVLAVGIAVAMVALVGRRR